MRFLPKTALLAWLVAVSCLAVCHLNHPRLWIQDLLCSVSLYWIPFVLAGFVWALARCVKLRSCSVALLWALVVQGYLLVRVATVAMPYVSFSRWPEAQAGQSVEVPVLFSHVDFAQNGLARLSAETARRAPSIVVLVGEPGQLAAATESMPGFPRVLDSTPPGVTVLSRFDLEDGSRTSLGTGALPGMFLKLRVPRVGSVLLGVLDLIPAASQRDFFLSKVTSRRIASSLRYQKEPRVVVGSFDATPFAPIVNMYPRQLGLRSVMFGQGLVRTFDLQDPVVRLALDNAFVSKEIGVKDFELLNDVSLHRAAMSFVMSIPARE